MTLNREHCKLVPIRLMTLLLNIVTLVAFIMVAIFKDKPWQNLTLMTLDREPCQLVPIWLMTLSFKPCHTGDVCMVANIS